MSEEIFRDWKEAERLEALRLWNELHEMGRGDDFPTTVVSALRLMRSFWRIKDRAAAEAGHE